MPELTCVAGVPQIERIYGDILFFFFFREDVLVVQLMHSLVTPIFLYASESWTLTAEL